MAPASPDRGGAWTDEHTVTLLRGIVSVVLARRPELYALPGLEDVKNNGGSRINKKIQQILAGVPGADGLVKDEVAKTGRGGGKVGTPRKPKAGGEAGKRRSPKKRKASEATSDDDELDNDEAKSEH